VEKNNLFKDSKFVLIESRHRKIFSYGNLRVDAYRNNCHRIRKYELSRYSVTHGLEACDTLWELATLAYPKDSYPG
jgi:hypothetical protein